MYRRLVTVVAVAALTIPTTAAFAATDDDSSGRLSKSESRGAIGTTVIPKSLESGGTVTVVVELQGDPTAVVEADSGRELTDSERQTVVDNLQEQQTPVVDAVEDVGGNVQATMQSAYNGVQASVPAEELAAIAALPNVVKIHEVNTYSIDNAVSVPFLGVPQVWQDTGYTGENIKLAVIDTGIDFTHADFGGPGTVEAYEAADAVDTEPADPALFGPNAPRVKGGYDFVGDDYDASAEDGRPNLVPQPDPNPLDCNGHGSHVAGTAGGSGVTAAGETYTGPYDASTPSQDWLIGPGVAPQVDLYALRVFGCAGSTDVTVAAIDWAVANDMDVINMSLGSDWGRADDPTAVASTNAIGAGVVVVASAGNSGPSPYIAGSPGSADGVVSVAAVDSTESFPGATVTVNGQAVPAINANGADLSDVGTLTVVRLVDDPATNLENEALGCSVAAYTKNGIVPGGNQLAVSLRGSCARAAKPIFAQQAGAAAALMINTTNDYPPYEGPITANPDNGEPYTVTIPFLGVRSSDAAAFTTGATATIVAAVLPNPGFRGYASFSSNGPRVGDSAVHVDVAAPGVSIVSAGVGAGTGSATISGTSMAAPHVAGVAALVAQAHPRWNAAEVSSAVVSSADPEKVAGQQATRGGVGLVDTAQAVTTQTTATGDAFSTDSGRLRQATLSFGFKESWLGFLATKTVTIQNSGSTAVTYTTSAAPSAQSEKATVSTFPSTVTVPAGGKAKVIVLLSAPASAVGSSTAGPDQFSFYEFSGDVVLTTSASTLRVPYLLVPRSDSRVASPTTGLFRPNETVVDGTASVRLRNNLGALDAAADFFTWGLSDGDGDVQQPEGVTDPLVDAGTDLRAAGTQTALDEDGNEVVVFAVNNHSRWSNAAAVEFDVLVDTDGDGTEDAVVFAADSGLVGAGDSNGVTEVFLIPDLHAEEPEVFRTGFYATAPTDSSTILMPVYAEDLGLTSDAGRFDYTVQSFESFSSGEDAFDGWASYDPWQPALSNGQYQIVPRNGSVTVEVEVDAAAVADQKPLGVMAVVLDNKSGAGEAVLVKIK